MNEAVEQAHRDGVLTTASLMVAGPAAADAVRRARALPSLKVGLHLVVIEGSAVLGPAEIPSLVRPTRPTPRSQKRKELSFPSSVVTAGRSEGFLSDQLALALRYAFHAAARRQLAAEIRAQFAAFAATGLRLDHANAHKHMHLHPTVGRLLIHIGRDYDLRAVRVPAEPPAVLAQCGERPGLGARALHAWTAYLRRQVRRAGMLANDQTFGVAWSGHMTAARLTRLAARLPPGLSEIYCHPATRREPNLVELMPEYEHEAEFAALLDSGVAAALAASGAVATDFSTEASRCSP